MPQPSDSILLKRLINIFGKPDSPNPAAFIDEYARIIFRFDGRIQDKAADFLIDNGGKSWPSTKAVRDACLEAAESLALEDAKKPRPISAPKPIWELQAEQATSIAKALSVTSQLGQMAFEEGWGRKFFLYAQSWAREILRTSRTPQLDQFSMPQDAIDYYRRYAVAPGHMRWLDRVALLGEDQDKAIQDCREKYGPTPPPIQGRGKTPTTAGSWVKLAAPAWAQRMIDDRGAALMANKGVVPVPSEPSAENGWERVEDNGA
jgi:hypothetical protein